MNFTVSHNSTISVQPESSLYLLLVASARERYLTTKANRNGEWLFLIFTSQTRVKRRNAEAQKKEWTVYNFTAKVNASAQERPDEAA